MAEVKFRPFLLYSHHEGRDPVWYAICRESGLRWRVDPHPPITIGDLPNAWGYVLVPKPKPKGNRFLRTDDDWRELFNDMDWSQLHRGPAIERGEERRSRSHVAGHDEMIESIRSGSKHRRYRPIMEKDPEW